MRGIVGNERAQALLERAVAGDGLRHAYLLHGPASVGKLTLALAFAQALLCQRRQPGEVDACGECVACRKVAHGNHPDLTIIEPEKDKRWLKLEALQEAMRLATLAPAESAHRILIIPEADRIQERTTNAFLKTLEEPPEGVVIILITTDAENMLPTVLSRCQMIPLRLAPAAEIAAALRERWGVAPDAAERLAASANGRMGWAVRAHEHPEEQAARERLVERIVSLVGAAPDERMRVAASFGSDNAACRVALEQWIAWWRDVTLAANGARGLLSAGATRQAAERVGAALTPAQAREFLDALIDAHASMDINANPRLTLENLALALPGPRRQPSARR
ncbi:MAG TPA: DNA polymerase III subunit delta' [Ktedonobacterales bacterium]